MDSSIILREKEAGKNMIRVDNVSKSYGDKRVLNNVSCEFEDGKIYCIKNIAKKVAATSDGQQSIF